jgi:hypothetical protein
MCSGVIPRRELVSIFVTLISRIYKGGQGPPSKQKIIRSFYTKGIHTTIQDVGCYAPCSPNLSKVLCSLHLRVPDLGVPSPKTYHLGYIPRWAAG